jgi:hypothetical protein
MPIFLYRHPETQEIREIIQSVHEPHTYKDENGTEWHREFTVPQAAIDTKWDANSGVDFANKTRNKKGTIGDMIDKSRELSKQREEKNGVDLIKQKHYDEYAKLRHGKRHIMERKEKLQKIVKDTVIKYGKKYG